MRKNKILLLIFLFTSYHFFAQDSIALNYENYISWVQKNHPIIKISDWEKNIAQNNILKAKALLDPNISAKMGEKKIDNTLYYSQKNIELNLPTWYGIDFNIGTNDLAGNKLNNEETKGVLNHVGISIPLARDLVYNKRRTAIQQSKNFSRMTFYEQEMLKNEILLEANFSFWEWVKNYEVLKLQKKNVELNKKRFEFIKKTFSYGERAAIDTVEAESQLQSFQIQEKEAYLNFVKSTQDLQWYLWQDNLEFYEIKAPIFPSEKMNTEITNDYLFLAQKLNKENLINSQFLKYYAFKNNILESEKKLKWQSFLPKIDFSYQFFNKENKNAQMLPLFDNNFQYGLKLEIPVFLRGARADYEQAKLKLLQNQQDIKVKENELMVKTVTYQQEVENYNEQISLAEQNLNNYEKLLKAEEIRFENGESSIFLINSRENKKIDAQEKLINLKAKVIKSYNKLKWMSESIEQ